MTWAEIPGTVTCLPSREVGNTQPIIVSFNFCMPNNPILVHIPQKKLKDHF